MPVLVDVPTISVALAGTGTPQSVQIAIGGLTPGQSLVVTGSIAGGFTWTVRGGAQVITAEQVVLTDTASPINVPITYTVTIEDQAFTSDAITVPFADGDFLLQGLDGSSTVPFVWHATGDPRDMRVRSIAMDVPGRDRPVSRWDVTGGESGRLAIRTTRIATDTLLTHLRTRGPVMLLRTNGQIRDLDAVAYLMITGATRRLWDAVVGGSLSTDRVWDLAFEVIGDPEPGAILPTATWDDFDEVYAASTWDDFDSEWSGSTWLEFDREDWASR